MEQMTFWFWVLVYLVTVNVVTCAIVVFDRHWALRTHWRNRRRTLLFMALIGGALGVSAGQLVLRQTGRQVGLESALRVTLLVQSIIAAGLALLPERQVEHLTRSMVETIAATLADPAQQTADFEPQPVIINRGL